jgi:hypothetical protein
MTEYEYILIEWPESQAFMDYYWFDEESSLADGNQFGSCAYFIPKNRWLDTIVQYPQLPQDSYDGGQINEP